MSQEDMNKHIDSIDKLLADLTIENQKLITAIDEFRMARNQSTFFMDGYRNGSASISEVNAANEVEYKAFTKLIDLAKR